MPALRVFLLSALIAFAASAGAQAAPAILVDAQSGAILHAHEAERPWYPASLTKLMTTYLAFEAMAAGRVSAQTPVTFSARAAAERTNGLGLPEGAEIPLDLAIRVLMVKSANDVAIAVAESLAGDVESFVATMNATAARLGMKATRFVNPHGLFDPNHVSTARVMAVLALALTRQFPGQRGYFALRELTVGEATFPNHNQLLGRFAGADGMKTGYLCAAGWNLAATATRDGRTLIAVVLGAVREGQREAIAGQLLAAGFAGALDGSGAKTSAATSGPVDMRPYACEGEPVPAALADFGVPVPLPPPRPAP